MSELREEELRARFAALRKHDSYAEPGFREMLGDSEIGGRKESARVLPRTRWIAAAAGLILAAALLIGKTRLHNAAPSAARALPSITSWQSPTAGLLRPPVRELIAPQPLLSSVFDSVTSSIQVNQVGNEGE